MSDKGAGFELTYRDSENTIHFSFFTTPFLPPSQKISISKHNTYKTRKRAFSLTVKQKLFCSYHYKRLQ